MQKVVFFSVLMILGLVGSQVLPHWMDPGTFDSFKVVSNSLLYICLAFIMINVGREFEINKKQWRSYLTDYLVAMLAAALPWIFVAFYYMFVVAPEMGLWKIGDAWSEMLLLTRFAAPTSGGILFTMLAAVGLRRTWIYGKVQVLAIFDDLDTIILMIPIQMAMLGMKWQMFVIVIVAVLLLWLGWSKMHQIKAKQSWYHILLYAVLVFAVITIIEIVSTHFYGPEGKIHIEILLPAFVLGVLMKHDHQAIKNPLQEEKVSSGISYIFMFLVGLSMPLFIGADVSEGVSVHSHISYVPMMPWSEIMVHVVLVTIISNVGKMAIIFFYRDRLIQERLSIAIGMFARGEVGAGVLIIAMGYKIGGPLLIISVLTLSLNLILTGFFIAISRNLAFKAEAIRAGELKA